jgi:DNA-directed RNA polymerase subunit M/transcription elongation factor TFIIS
MRKKIIHSDIENPEKRVKKDNENITVRDVSLHHIMNVALTNKDFSSLKQSDKNNIVNKMENYINDNTKSLREYKIAIGRILYHIDGNSPIKNNDVMKKIIKSYNDETEFDFTAESKILYPNIAKPFLDEFALRSQQKAKIKTSTEYTCPRCHKSKTIITEVVKRSLDEPTNFEATCVNCRYKWIVA